MKFRLTIGTKIGLGFGIITLCVIVNSFLTTSTLNKSVEANERITNVYEPSVSNLTKLQELLNNSKMLVRSWVFIDKKEDATDKLLLRKVHKTDFPALDDSIQKLQKQWDKQEQDQYKRISASIKDTLFVKHQFVMDRLNSFESYDDPLTVFEVTPLVTEGGEIMATTDSINKDLQHLIKEQENIVKDGRIEIFQLFKRFQNFIVMMGLLLTIIAIAISLFTIKSLVAPINYIKKILLSMGKGILPEEKIREGNDEIGQMSVAMNQLVAGLRELSDFSSEIGKGNFDKPFTPLSKDDMLGNSLLRMRDDLKNAALEEEKRKGEDQQRNWATQGVAKFSELLRKDNENMETLSYNIISNLVKYMESNQGGLFILNDNDPENKILEMAACYAYNRRKYVSKQIEIGEGLVGRCVQEGETIYLTDIPDNYITITSGLGESNPTCLILVPLKLNDEIFGVIEIASFKNIEPYQIEFVEKIGESIAATISTVRINIRTQNLLEQSQQQAEEMSAQEEEMRQNMEELRATQEQSSLREAELRKALDELKSKNA
jgi:methyl-accepting chemotaxis protein